MHDDFPHAFSQTFHVRYDECGVGGALRASVHLRLFQELAFAHSAALGFPLSWYEQHRLFWLVRRVQLVVRAPAQYGQALIYTTRVLGARRVLARRLNTVRRSEDGADIATAIVDWILTEDGVAPTRIPDEISTAFPALMRRVTPIPLEEHRPPSGVAETPLWVRASDVDPMGHANNAVYLDLLDDAIVRAGGPGAVDSHPRTYDLMYHHAAKVGALLQDVSWREGELWHYRLVRPSGTLLLHGRLSDAEADTYGKDPNAA
ncbi:MAG: acyl-ACP thioesterase domain-containing protein [Armatimonadota bacterium]